MGGNESGTIMRPFEIGAHNNQIGAPATRSHGNGLLLLLLSTSSIRLSHSRTVHSLTWVGLDLDLDGDSARQLGFAHPSLHPLPTYLPFTALLSPLRQSTVLHFEPSAGQVKAKANKQPAVSAGNILWGVRPSRQQPLQARRRLPRYLNPTELIYPSLCQGRRAHDSPCFKLQRSFRAAPKDYQNPLPSLATTECRGAQLTDDPSPAWFD